MTTKSRRVLGGFENNVHAAGCEAYIIISGHAKAIQYIKMASIAGALKMTFGNMFDLEYVRSTHGVEPRCFHRWLDGNRYR
jgi:hypothetical protein